MHALLCAVFPDAKGIFAHAVRTPAVRFSSESENISIEVSVVCAFIIGGADLGHGSAAHAKASQVIWEASGYPTRPLPPGARRSFVGPVSYLLARYGCLGHSGLSSDTWCPRVGKWAKFLWDTASLWNTTRWCCASSRAQVWFVVSTAEPVPCLLIVCSIPGYA